MRLVSIPLTIVLVVLVGGLASAALFMAGLITGDFGVAVLGATGLIILGVAYGIAELIREQSNAQILALAEIADALGADYEDPEADPVDDPSRRAFPAYGVGRSCNATRRGHPGVCVLPFGHDGPHSVHHGVQTLPSSR